MLAHIDALSRERMSSYTKATLGNKKLALDLYEKNIQLSKLEFEYIGRFELILRNKANVLLSNKINNKWYNENWINNAGLLSYITDAKNKINEKQYKIRKKRNLKFLPPVTNGDMISSFTFSFWRKLFNEQPSLIFQNHYSFQMLEIYKDVSDRKQIYKDLYSINKIRNRVAHHEPIILSLKDGKKVVDTSSIVKLNEIIEEHFNRLDIDRNKVNTKIDENFSQLIRDVNEINTKLTSSLEINKDNAASTENQELTTVK